MADFFRYPSTPHLVWLGGSNLPRGDKCLSATEVDVLLAGDVTIEEKIDGANVGLSIGESGDLLAQNRGSYLTRPYFGQFVRLQEWLDQHGNAIEQVLDKTTVLFGEWSAARHSIGYDRLPDWFLLFDVYDRSRSKFWSTTRRDELAVELGLVSVPILAKGGANLGNLQHLLSSRTSQYRAGPMEGLIVRRETDEWCEGRAKLVRADFTQEIGEHWSRRRIEWNRVDWASSSIYR